MDLTTLKSVLILVVMAFMTKRCIQGPQKNLARASLFTLLCGMVAILIGAPDRESALVMYVGAPLFLVGNASSILLIAMDTLHKWSPRD